MRVPSVVPRYAVTVGSLLRGNGDRENTWGKGKVAFRVYFVQFCINKKQGKQKEGTGKTVPSVSISLF